jgi:hypothetical protein
MPVLGRNFEAAEEGDRTEALALLVNARCMMVMVVDVEGSEQRRPERGRGGIDIEFREQMHEDSWEEGREKKSEIEDWMDRKLQKKLPASPKAELRKPLFQIRTSTETEQFYFFLWGKIPTSKLRVATDTDTSLTKTTLQTGTLNN